MLFLWEVGENLFTWVWAETTNQYWGHICSTRPSPAQHVALWKSCISTPAELQAWTESSSSWNELFCHLSKCHRESWPNHTPPCWQNYVYMEGLLRQVFCQAKSKLKAPLPTMVIEVKPTISSSQGTAQGTSLAQRSSHALRWRMKPFQQDLSFVRW